MEFAAFASFWIAFSLLSAFFHASRLAVTKHLSFSFSTRALTLYVNLASLVVTLPLIVWHHDFPLHEPGLRRCRAARRRRLRDRRLGAECRDPSQRDLAGGAGDDADAGLRRRHRMADHRRSA
jgi:hypothetical protein